MRLRAKHAYFLSKRLEDNPSFPSYGFRNQVYGKVLYNEVSHDIHMPESDSKTYNVVSRVSLSDTVAMKSTRLHLCSPSVTVFRTQHLHI